MSPVQHSLSQSDVSASSTGATGAIGGITGREVDGYSPTTPSEPRTTNPIVQSTAHYQGARPGDEAGDV